MTARTHGRAPVAAGSLICDGDLGRLSRSGSYASRQMLARLRFLHHNCHSVNVNVSKVPPFAERKPEAVVTDGSSSHNYGESHRLSCYGR